MNELFARLLPWLGWDELFGTDILETLIEMVGDIQKNTGLFTFVQPE
jgi:hypothetical protein